MPCLLILAQAFGLYREKIGMSIINQRVPMAQLGLSFKNELADIQGNASVATGR